MKNMRRVSICIILIAVAAALLLGCGGYVSSAEEYSVPDDQSVPESIDDLLDKLDLGSIQSLLDSLDGDSIQLFGFSDIYDRVKAAASGEAELSAGGVMTHIFALLGTDALEYAPMLLSVLAIALAYSLISSLRGKYASEAIEKTVYFATTTLMLCLVVGYFGAAIATAVKFIASVKTQINAVAPVMITLMTAAGASSTAGVYTPTVAFIGTGMTNAITYIVFPAILMALVFDMIGCVSTSVKLDKTADFFRSCAKWLLGAMFFIFMAALGASGIAASVRDGISAKAARFAMSKYVPVIGGYLSQGFDYVMAGNVLIKNAVGSSAIAIIVLTAAPVIARLVVFSLTLKLTAALSEPLGGQKFSGVISAIEKSASMVTAGVIAMTFIYIMFLTMTVCTGNIAL